MRRIEVSALVPDNVLKSIPESIHQHLVHKWAEEALKQNLFEFKTQDIINGDKGDDCEGIIIKSYVRAYVFTPEEYKKIARMINEILIFTDDQSIRDRAFEIMKMLNL